MAQTVQKRSFRIKFPGGEFTIQALEDANKEFPAREVRIQLAAAIANRELRVISKDGPPLTISFRQERERDGLRSRRLGFARPGMGVPQNTKRLGAVPRVVV